MLINYGFTACLLAGPKRLKMSNYGASTPTSATAIAFLIQKLERYNCALSSEDRFKILSDIFDYTEEKLAEKNVDALCGFLKALREQCVVYNVVFENAAIIAVLRGCFRIREHSPDWVLLRDHVAKTATKRQMRGLL